MEFLKERLSQAAEIDNEIDRRMAVIAVVTRALQSVGIRPVLVGGMAVEFYTAGGYSTVDIDMVASHTSKLETMMTELGFDKEGRHWHNAGLGAFIEMPAPPLAGSSEKVNEVDYDGLPVYVIGIEDLILDRLRALEYWTSEEDGRWAHNLMFIHREIIDWRYLEEQVATEELTVAFERTRPR